MSNPESHQNNIYTATRFKNPEHQGLAYKYPKAFPQIPKPFSGNAFFESAEPISQNQREGVSHQKKEVGGIQHIIRAPQPRPQSLPKHGLSNLQGWVIISLLLVLCASIGILAFNLNTANQKVDSLELRVDNKVDQLQSSLEDKVGQLRSTFQRILDNSLNNQKELSQTISKNSIQTQAKITSLEQSLANKSHQAQPNLGPVLEKLDSVQGTVDFIKVKTPATTFQLNEQLYSLNLKIELVRDHSASPLIGGSMTLVAIKNETSYMIGTIDKGFVIYENGEKVTEGSFSSSAPRPYGIIYAKETDCYYLIVSGKLFRKRIDGSPFEQLISGGLGWNNHDSPVFYSERLKRIITVRSPSKTLTVVDPFNGLIEFQTQIPFGAALYSYKTFGKNGEYILFSPNNRNIGVFKYDKSKKMAS